jgi:hypothetical protein
VDFRMTGGDELAAVGRRVKAAGNRGLSKEFRAGLAKAARPATEAARRGARDDLPSQGGLNETVAAGKFTAKVKVTGSSADLTVSASAGMDLPALDRGRLRHPVYGHRGTWVNQTIPAGWFSKRMEEQADRVIEPVVKAAFDMLDKL